MTGSLLILLAQIAIPTPRGYVNDFADVLDAGTVARLESVIGEVRAATRGEIAVVTLADIGDRAASDVAVEIGRQWGVGARGEAGDPAKNLGVVILLVPLKDHRPGTGHIFVATGRGAEGFLPDARVGRIRDAMIPHLAREDYGAGLERGVGLVAQAFADEFGATLTGRAPPPERRVAVNATPMMVFAIIILATLLMFLAPRRGRRRRAWWWGAGPWIGGGWGGGGGGGGRGGFGGGFGGFGGGGGFSGGGAGGRF